MLDVHVVVLLSCMLYLISMQTSIKILTSENLFSCWNWKWNLWRKSCRKSFKFIFFNLLILHDMIKGGWYTSQNNTTCQILFFWKIFYYSYNLNRDALCWVIRIKNKIYEKIILQVPDIINLSSKIILVLSNNNRVQCTFIKITTWHI